MSWILSCIGCGAKKLPNREEARFLDFQHCLLKTVPFEVFQNERILQELILDSNQISELPPELFHCHELCILSLSDNELQSIPTAVSSLINLQSLNFCKNGISDIPDSIKACKKLSRVDASTNPLCRIPEGVTQLVALKELSLNDTFLDYLPANFGRLTGLEILELRENQLNTLPRSMTRLTALRRLDLGQNEYSELPEVVGHLISLTDIWFDGNKIKSIPMDIGNLTELRFIDASRNRIREICPEIGSCKKLSYFYLNFNELETLPDKFCECKNLTTLCLDENIIGQLPESLGELDQLNELNISHNELTHLPSSVGLLRELRVMHVDHNLLEQLPPEIGSCSQLIILTAAHNQITHLPPELANISKLRVINVCGNQVEYLPVSFTKLQVTGLWLSENQTKPTVPMQCKIDTPTGQKVLTCYMLPQLPYEEKIYKDDSGDWPIAEADVMARRAKSLIHFALVTDRDEPGLSRIPTPYPKELRALARHTKNLKSLSKVNNSSQNTMITIGPVKLKQDSNQIEMESVSLSKTINIVSSNEAAEEILIDNSNKTIEKSLPIANAGDEGLANKELVECHILKRNAIEIPKKCDNATDISQQPLKTQIDLSLETNMVPKQVPLEVQIPHRITEEGSNNSLQYKEIKAISIRPASIAAPEISKVAEAVEDYLISNQQKVSWQYQRPGSLAVPRNETMNPVEMIRLPFTNKFDIPSPDNHNLKSLNTENTTDLSSDRQQITVDKMKDSEKIRVVKPLKFDTERNRNLNKQIYSSANIDSMTNVENIENFLEEVDNNQTKIPLYSPPSKSSCNQFSQQKFTLQSDYVPSKTTNTKVAYQSKLPTLGTPNKNTLSHSISEKSDEANKTRIPTVSPVAKSMKSHKENYASPPRTQNKTTVDSPFEFESRIPSFSAKHSTFVISPVEKPINTTGIPAISPPSRDSSLKKKSGIPLSKSKPIGHQVSPAEKGLKSPRGTNQGWK